MSYDLNDAQPQMAPIGELIPDGTFAKVRLTVRPGGVVSAILYSGQVIGTDEKQTVLEYLRALPLKSFTVLVCDFANWAETAPLPCFILKK